MFRYIDKSSNPERIVAGLRKALEVLQSDDICIHKKDNERAFISKNDIVFVEVKYKTVYLQTTKERFVVRQKMEYFKEQLDTGFFVFPHNSFIVNMNHIVKYKRDFLELTGGYSVPIASRKQALLKKQFLAFMGEGYGIISSDT